MYLKVVSINERWLNLFLAVTTYIFIARARGLLDISLFYTAPVNLHNPTDSIVVSTAQHDLKPEYPHRTNVTMG